MVESKFDSKISKLRCDNGGEYCSKEFVTYCKNRGIIIDYNVAYTPQQNGKAERKNRSLVERSRAMLVDSGLPKEFWGEAIRTANYVINRGISANLKGVTPAEIWYKVKPNVKNMRIFGCIAYSHIPKDFRTKLDSKAKKCIMVGYAPTGYRLWDVNEKKIIISRDVEFDERNFYFKRNMIELNDDLNEKPEMLNENEVKDKENDKNETANENIKNENEGESDNEVSNEILNKRTNRRSVKPPSKYEDYELYMAFDATAFVENVPNTYDELLNRDDKMNWLNAVNKELESIKNNDTWEEVEKPKEKNILDTKWVFTYKTLEEKQEDKYKARLVVRGFAQEKNKNFDDIYSPVAKMTTVRALLIIGNQLKYHFQQLDVKTAFLNGTLKENIYIFSPQGVECRMDKVIN